MRTTMLPGAGIRTSVLGLGTAHLFCLPGARQRRRILQAAYDHGIRHFDTAPMYGLGIAERELGRFLRGRRDQLVISTKFGIAPTAAARGLARVQGPLRRLLSATPALQNRARTHARGPASGAAGALLYRVPGYSAASAQQCLQASLTELATDYLDLFLLHDPSPGTVRSDEVCAYLEQAREAGLIRAWGVAGEPEPSREVIRMLPAPHVVLQVRDDVLLRRTSTPEPAQPRITFGILGRALPVLHTFITASPARCQSWSTSLGADCADLATLASVLLRDALRANPDGVVLIGTTQERHLRSAAETAASHPGAADELGDAFTRLLHEIPVRTSGTSR